VKLKKEKAVKNKPFGRELPSKLKTQTCKRLKAMKSKKPNAEIFHKTCKRFKAMKSEEKTHLICSIIKYSNR
jgi:hypothetical protein